MLIRQFCYPGIRVDLCSLAEGEPYAFDADASRDCVATIYTSDSVIVPESGAWSPIRSHRRLRHRSQWGGWRTPAITSGKRRFVGGAGGSTWTCISLAAETQQLELAGSAIVPAGWGFVVARGACVLGDPGGPAGLVPAPEPVVTIVIDRTNEDGVMQFRRYGLGAVLGPIEGGAQAGEPGNYFAPQAVDSQVTGNGDLVLVR